MRHFIHNPLPHLELLQGCRPPGDTVAPSPPAPGMRTGPDPHEYGPLVETVGTTYSSPPAAGRRHPPVQMLMSIHHLERSSIDGVRAIYTHSDWVREQRAEPVCDAAINACGSTVPLLRTAPPRVIFFCTTSRILSDLLSMLGVLLYGIAHRTVLCGGIRKW